MLHYLKKYPLTWLVIAAILYLSFFKPPQTDMNEIPGIDKLVHICMYGGLCFLIWVEFLRSHRTIQRRKMFIGAILLPILFSSPLTLASRRNESASITKPPIIELSITLLSSTDTC